mmetsp:Transcript_106745/g.307038  ORF Transcript_106745/g.307038 Transcript_106745/m.307038 type:complete len:222 (-) Transcript_106745:170-835(-)
MPGLHNGVLEFRELVELLAEEVLDALEELDVVLGHECDRAPRSAGARRAANAMDVVLGVLGNVVVDDEVHGRHVQPARRDVGTNEDPLLLGLKALQGAQSLRLRHLPVQADRRPSQVPEKDRQLLRREASICKDHHGVMGIVGDERCKVGLFEFGGDEHVVLHQARSRVVLRADLDLYRSPEARPLQLRHLRCHRRGEKERVPLGRDDLQDLVEGLIEVHR